MRQAGIYPHSSFGRLVQNQFCARLNSQYDWNPPFDLDNKEIWTNLWMSRIGNYLLVTKISRSQGHARNKFANRIKYSMSKWHSSQYILLPLQLFSCTVLSCCVLQQFPWKRTDRLICMLCFGVFVRYLIR